MITKDFNVYIFHQKIHYNIQKQISVSINMASSLHTLPVELVYRVLDNLPDETIFLSLINVCTRLDTIIKTYHRYQVNSSGKFTFRTTLSLRTPDGYRKDRVFVMKNTGCSERVVRNVGHPFQLYL
jgi:hypothetical protein